MFRRKIEFMDNTANNDSSNQKTDVPYKKKFGDRKDGRRIRSMEPLSVVAPFIMPVRSGATVYFTDSIELTEINKYIHKKRAEGLSGFGAMHVFYAAYVRTISQRPGINRFLSGLRIFARNDIQIGMEVKKELTLNAPGTMMKFFFKPQDTAYDIYNQMNKMITDYKKSVDEPSAFDNFAKVLGIMPRWLMKLAIGFINWMDYYGLIPVAWTNLSPFHGSCVMTAVGSLGIKPVFHHLYNFGNVPVFISFSTSRHENVLSKEGIVEKKQYLDFNVVVDERICDGQYYASAFHELRKYLKNPHLLDTPPETVVQDIY